MTRRYRHYTKAGDVTVIKADTGEVLDTAPAYGPREHRDVVATGQKRSDPARRRAANRRQPNSN